MERKKQNRKARMRGVGEREMMISRGQEKGKLEEKKGQAEKKKVLEAGRET